ncbi:MAG: redoxin domain-containing protein [Chloroflexi bacterium]|nr:redoxin domain-containing protein [Chloroflexota bacterium]
MQTNTLAPDFSLVDNNGHTHRLSEHLGQVVLVNFWSAECPWSERADQELAALINRFPGKLALLNVASNLNETGELIAQVIPQRKLDFVLMDNNCELADAWGAQTTPHVYVIDQSGILRYQGAIDDVSFRKRIPNRFYVDEAVIALLSGLLPDTTETSSYGCTIVRNM